MKKQGIPLLISITLFFTGFILGMFYGINLSGTGIQVSVPASMETVPPPEITVPVPTASQVTFPININTATKEEFMALPGIGAELAQRILNYREAVILFSAPEELMNVEGIGKGRLEEIIHLVSIGG